MTDATPPTCCSSVCRRRNAGAIRFVQRQPLPSSLQIRPRRFALGLAVITAAMLLAAINYGNNLIFLIAFMMIALMINSAWQGWRALSAVTARVMPPEMRPAGAPGSFAIELGTPNRALPPLVVDAGTDRVEPTSATAGNRTTLSLDLPGEPRGYLPLPEITLETPYPLGLWRISRRLSPAIGQWVYPSPEPGEQRGERHSNEASGTQPAMEGDPTRLRGYHPGDPIRHVVFRHYAKSGQLLTRHPESDEEQPDPERIDYAAFVGPREVRLSAMTERLMELERVRRPWVLLLPGKEAIRADSSTNRAGRYRAALQQLARFERPRDPQGFDHVPPGESY